MTDVKGIKQGGNIIMNKSLRKLFSLALALALVFSSGLGVGNITAQAEEKTNTEFTDLANLDAASKEHIEFVNEKGDKLPNTCYSYLRSFLEESGLIQKVSTNESKLTNPSDKIFTQIIL